MGMPLGIHRDWEIVQRWASNMVASEKNLLRHIEELKPPKNCKHLSTITQLLPAEEVEDVAVDSMLINRCTSCGEIRGTI